MSRKLVNLRQLVEKAFLELEAEVEKAVGEQMKHEAGGKEVQAKA